MWLPVPCYPCDPLEPGETGLLRIKSDRLWGSGRAQARLPGSRGPPSPPPPPPRDPDWRGRARAAAGQGGLPRGLSGSGRSQQGGRPRPRRAPSSHVARAAPGGGPAGERRSPGGLCPEGVEGEGPWGVEDAHFPLCALYPRLRRRRGLSSGATMCGLVSERPPPRGHRLPISSPAPDLGSAWPKAWGSDLALRAASGIAGPRPSPPAVEDAFPQVLRSLFASSVDSRFAANPPGRFVPGSPAAGGQAPRAGSRPVRWVVPSPPGAHGPAQPLRPLRCSGVSY